MGDWIVMSATDLTKGHGDRSFETNATGLTEAQADAEAARRNKIECQAGNKGTTWFKSMDPLAMMRQMGLDIGSLR